MVSVGMRTTGCERSNTDHRVRTIETIVARLDREIGICCCSGISVRISWQFRKSRCPDQVNYPFSDMNSLDTKLDRLNNILGSPFSDHSYLELAMTHRSAGPRNFERLEFLGDSILNFVIADSLYRKFPTAREGQLSRLRARLVKRVTLAELARDFNLGEYLIMGSGELKSGGYKRDSILSDAFEAIVGAIYIDQGLEVVTERLEHWFQGRIESLSLDDTQKDPKTRLQEFLQSCGSQLPEYSVISVAGKAHDQVFNVECRIELLKKPSSGTGGSRRQAEQMAAGAALEQLGIAED